MSIYAIIPLVSFIAYFPLIFLIAFRRPLVRVQNVFILYLLAATIWSFCSFMGHVDLYQGHTHIWVKFIILTLVWMAVTYYHFVRAFLNKPNGFGVLLGYVFLAILAVLVVFVDFPKSAEVKGGALHIDYGPYFYLLPAFLIPLAGAAAFFLVQRFRRLSDSLDRNRVVYLLIGLGVVAAGILTNLSSSLGIYPLDHVANLANAIIISYAILKYQLLDFRIVIRRGLSYSVVTIGLTTAYLLLLFVIQRSVFNWPSYRSVAVAAGLALLFAIAFQPLRNVIQRGVDRLFYRRTYDYRQTLLTFSQRMSNVLNLGELAENILYPITKALYAKRAYLFLPEAEGGDFVARFVEPAAANGSDGTMRLGRDNPVVTWLSREGRVLYRETIDIAPEFKSLWETEGDDIDALELALFCPITRKGNLIGILGLSRKHRSTPYSNEDVDLLATMATEVAIAIENAMMLDNLREQQQRVEQLLAKTVLAQEDERKRISVELHDSVAQWLVGASYRMQACKVLLSGSDNDQVQSEIAEIEDTIDRSLKEIRRMMAGLHPPALDELGLVHALRQLLEGLKPDSIAYHFEPIGKPVRLPPSAELAIYRVVQESLNNIRKHSGASAVVLRLRFEPENVSVEIHDNGAGFNYSRTRKSAVSVGHMGLVGMEERTTMLGGTLKIKTRQGSGTTIFLTLPVTMPEVANNIDASEHSSRNV